MLLGRQPMKNIPWSQLIIESLLVILSVVLALALSNWNQNRINENLAGQALQNIAMEMENNQQEVQQALEYNRALIDSLKKYPAYGITMKPAQIRDNAWETAQASGVVSNFDFKTISTVSEIHELQQDYKKTLDITAEFIYEANMKGRSAFEGRKSHPFLNNFYDITYQEYRLLEKYTEALAVIRNGSD